MPFKCFSSTLVYLDGCVRKAAGRESLIKCMAVFRIKFVVPDCSTEST